MGPRKWIYYYFYVILDLFSRYVVGWMVADKENASLTSRLIEESGSKYLVRPEILTLHSDIQRGHARREIVFEQKDVRHCDLMRWREVFSWGAGGEPAQVNPRMDVEAMIAAAVIPPYDTSLQVPEKAIADYDARWQRTPKGINHHGLYRASMPDTGGHDDRGLLPRWVAIYLLSMDPRLREAVIGADEMSGNAGIHARTARTGRIETQDARPLLWLADERAGNWGTERWRGVWQKGREIQKPAPPRTAEKIKSVFIPDLAHVPALAYGGYLATGDLFFLEETYFWASYALLSYNPGYREGIFNDGQMRGKAWGLRLGLMAALIAPGSIHLKSETPCSRNSASSSFRFLVPNAFPFVMGHTRFLQRNHSSLVTQCSLLD